MGKGDVKMKKMPTITHEFNGTLGLEPALHQNTEGLNEASDSRSIIISTWSNPIGPSARINRIKMSSSDNDLIGQSPLSLNAADHRGLGPGVGKEGAVGIGPSGLLGESVHQITKVVG